jgi:hypothetical protein
MLAAGGDRDEKSGRKTDARRIAEEQIELRGDLGP